MAKTDIDSGFADRFSALVRGKGWGELSRVKLGEKLGVSSTCAHFYLRGERLPSIEQARTLCRLFGGVCVEWLLTGCGGKYPAEEVNLQNYINVSELTGDQRALIGQMIAQFVKTPDEKDRNKTPPPPPAWVIRSKNRRTGDNRRIDDQIELLHSEPRTTTDFHSLIMHYKEKTKQ